jgi:hypothetical protein
MTITLVVAKVMTLLPDNTILKTYTISGSSWAHVDNRIAEKKRLEMEFNSDVNITGKDIFINTALFMRESNTTNTPTGKPPVYYSCSIPDASPGITYNAALQMPSPPPNFNIDANKNYEVKVLTGSSATNFKVQVDFFMIADTGAMYMTTALDNGIGALITDWGGDGVVLDATNSNMASFPRPPIPSVYNDYWVGPPFNHIYRSPRVYIYMETPGSTPLEFARYEMKYTGFKAGFYNRSAWSAAPWFTNCNFVLKRGGNPVTDFVGNTETNVEAFVTSSTPTEHLTKMTVWCIRTNYFDGLQDNFANYDFDLQKIEAASVASGKIQAPMTDPVNTSGNTWKVTFNVSALDVNYKYRLIGVAYSDNATYKVTSFISQEISVTQGVNYTGDGFDVIGRLDDYNREFRGNDLECVIEERMRSKIKLYFPFNKWKNDIFNRLGLVAPNDIRRYLNRVKVEIYNEEVTMIYPLVRNTYDLKVSNRFGANQYSTQAGMTLLFGNTWAEFQYEWRNRFEANTLCVQTLNGNVPVVPPMATQYWGGKTLKIRWTLNFFYDNYSAPFDDEVIIEQQIRVKDYGEMSVKFINETEGDFADVTNVCNDEMACYAGILQNPSLPDRYLIANIVPAGGAVNNMEESENWEGNQLPQLFTDKIPILYDAYQPLYSETAGRFCIDTSKLSVNSQYQISAIAKKFVETGKRIIELGNPRVTEELDRRIVEP